MPVTGTKDANLIDWWQAATNIPNVELAWLGQAGFAIRAGGLRLVIDPYLSDFLAEKYRGRKFPHIRMMDAPIQPDDLTATDLLFSTHDHTDHLDPGTLPGLLRVSPDARVIVPRFSVPVASERGVSSAQMVTLNVDECFEAALEPSIRVTALPACHEDIVSDDFGNSRWLGYVIRIGDITLYHSGDTIPSDKLEERLAGFAEIDLALLPSNGRDEERSSNGVPGNMTATEALGYHQRFEFKSTLLHHFGLFDFNTVDPVELRQEIDQAGLTNHVIVPEVGKIYEVSK